MKEQVLGDCFPKDISAGFHIFLEGDHRDGASLASVIDHYHSALTLARRENFLRLHYADMLRDLTTAFRRIAAHVGISHPPELEAELIKAATFKNMKANANRFAFSAGLGFWKNDAGFFDSATSNKWLGVLTETDLTAYDARISSLLNPEERHWLEWGSPAPSMD